MASTQKVIGSPLQNLVLETAGRVYIKVAEHYYELDFRNKTVEEVSAEESDPGEDSTAVNIDLSQYVNIPYLNKVLSKYATQDIVNNLIDLITDIQNNIEIPVFDDNTTNNQCSYVRPSIQTQYSFITSLLNGTEITPNFQVIDGDIICPPTVVKHSGINPPTTNQPDLGIKYYSRWEIKDGISDDASGLEIEILTDTSEYEQEVELGSVLCHLVSKEPVNVYLVIPKFTYSESSFAQPDSYENRTGVYTKVGPEGSYLFTYSTYDFEDDNNYYLLAAKVQAHGSEYDVTNYNYEHIVNAGDLNISQFQSNNNNIFLDLDAGTLRLGNKLIYENGNLSVDIPYFENRYQKSPTIPALTPTDLNPAGWSTSIPAYSEGDIIWMISCQRTKNALVTNWSGPIRITSPNIDTSVMRYIGRSTTSITDGGVEYPTINGQVIANLKLGDVVAYNAKEFVWIGSCWEELGDEVSYLPRSGGIITGDLTVNGVLESIGAMIIPDHSPANPITGKHYLYSDIGEYAEEPGGGGGGSEVYDLTIKKNSVLIGTYNLGTAAADVNIPISWSDVEDSTHRFVSDTEKQTWNSKYTLPSNGIPETDLSNAVQTSLSKADSAVQPSNIKTFTIQKNSETAVTYNPIGTNNITFNFTVPTTVAELSDASDYVTIATDQIIIGKKTIGNLSVTSSLAIPQSAPSNPDSNLKYLYIGVGEYAEEPGGGGSSADVYDLTIRKNSVIIGTYNLGTAAADVNIPISWNDLVPDTDHQFVTSTDIANWNTAYGWGDHSTQGYLKSTQAIPYIVGPSSDTAGYWTGSYSGITEYTDGLTVIYVPEKAGRSGGSYLNINGLGNIPCYYTASSKITTQYAVGVPILLTYRTYDGAGRWMRADYDSNTNTLVRVYRQTTGYNDDYPIIVSRTKTIGTVGTNDSYSAVYGVVHDTAQQPTVNPSTGEIKAAKFTGDVAWSNISSTPTTLVGYGITDGINEITTSGNGNAVTGVSVSGHVLTIAKENIFVDLTSTQIISGRKNFSYIQAIDYLSIPTVAPASPVGNEKYLYIGTGEYVEEPSGGGGVTEVYDLTIRKNQVSLGTYNLGTAAADINIPIDWSDLVEDADHQFVTSANKTTWNSKLDSISGSSAGMTVPYISGVTKNGTTLELTYSDMPTYIVNDGEFSLNAKIGSTTNEIADFTANQATNDDITFEQGNYIAFDITGTRTLKISGNYSAGTKVLFDTGTDTTVRVWSASVLKSTVAPIVHTHIVRSGLKSDGTTYITSTTDANNNITLGEVLASAGSYGDSSAQTPAYGATFKVPYITVNKQGIVTAISEHTVKIPASDNTNTAQLQVSDTTNKRINTIESTGKYIQFTGGTNSFNVKDSSGTNFDVAVTPSITNNVTYTGTPTANQLIVWDSAGVIKNSGYTVGSSGTLFSAFSGGGLSSSGNILTQAAHSITIGGKTLTAGASSDITIINTITSSASSTASANFSGTITVNGQDTTFSINDLYASYIQTSAGSSNKNYYLTFVETAVSNGQSLLTDTDIKYNPSTNTLTGANATFTGTGTFSGVLYIPAHTPGASSTDIAALYLGSGEYSEIPEGGGGSATVYDLTVQKNGVDIGTYNLGTADATVNITIGWTDLTEDSDHQFVTSTNKSNWNDAYNKRHTHDNKTVLDGISSTKVSNWDTAYGWGDHSQAGYLTSASLDGYVNDLEQTSGNYVTSISKSGKKITVTRATLPTTIALSNVTGADDLKAIEALTGTSGYLKKTAANTWTLDTTIAAAAYKAVDSSISSTSSTNLPTSAAVAAYVSSALTSVLKYKGTIGTGGTVTTLPANHQVGDCYVVKTAGTYAGKACEVGDYIICNTTRSTASDSDWDVVNGENQVENKNASLANAGSSVTIATVDGTDLTITTPSTWTGVTKTGTITKVGNTTSGEVTVSSANNTASFGSAVTVGSVGGIDLKFTMPNIYALTIKNSAGTTQLTYNPSTSTDNSITLTKAMVGLSNVENTALSTWAGSSNITTLGTITTGTWNGTKIANAYLANNSVTVGNATIALGGSATLTQIGIPTWAQASSKPSYTPVEIFGSTAIGNSTTPVYYNGTNLTTTTLANKYVTLDTEQTISGEKYFSTKLAIPTTAPTSPTTGRHYLYFDLSGNYSETPSGGGGSGTVYDLTLRKNSVSLGTYNLGTAAADINIPIDWSDLASHPTTLSGYGITDAYTKTEADTEYAKYLPLAGGTLTGNLTLSTSKTIKLTGKAAGVVMLSSSANMYTSTTVSSHYIDDHIRIAWNATMNYWDFVDAVDAYEGDTISTSSDLYSLIEQIIYQLQDTPASGLIYFSDSDETSDYRNHPAWVTYINDSGEINLTFNFYILSSSGDLKRVSVIIEDDEFYISTVQYYYPATALNVKVDGVVASNSNNYKIARYGVCSTGASSAAKTVSLTSGTFSLETGARVTVNFSYENTAANPTLKVGNSTAKNIRYKGANISSSNAYVLHGIVDFVYDGSYWVLVGNYQPLDADLTAIAGLTGTSGFLKKTAANTWALDTNTYALSSALSDYVPTSRKVNNKALSADITLSLDDVADGSTRKLSNYLPLTGGTITSTTVNPLILNSTHTGQQSILKLQVSGADKAAIGWQNTSNVGTYLQNLAVSGTPYVNIASDGKFKYKNAYEFYHTNNLTLSTLGGVPTTRTVNNKALSADITLSLDDVADGSTRKLSDYLPLTGGTISGTLEIAHSSDTKITLKSGDTDNYNLIKFVANDDSVQGYLGTRGTTDLKWNNYVIYNRNNLFLSTLAGSSAIGSTSKPVYYDGSSLVACGTSLTDYLPLAGGTLTGDLVMSSGTTLDTDAAKLAIPTAAPTSPDSTKYYLYVNPNGNYSE